LYSRQASAQPYRVFTAAGRAAATATAGDNVLLPQEQAGRLLVLHGIRFVLTLVGRALAWHSIRCCCR
jgi:hypothetical protein